MSVQPSAEETKICRISVENPPAHFQARTARRFAELWSERTHGSVKIEFYDGGRFFRDADAVSALARGQVEIIFPGIWQLDRYVPDVAALMLPSVYGRDVETMRGLVDGPFGSLLAAKLGTALDAATLGPWLDAGYTHIFTLAPSIRTAEDIEGKRIRVAGSKANEERIMALGAEAMIIPLADLTSYLDNRLVDGILSTYEAVDSARLDRHGIRAVFEDREYCPFYVPLVGRRFWSSLTEDERKAATESWKEVVSGAREDALRSHEKAKERLVARGLMVFGNSAEAAAKVRARLSRSEGETARRLNIPADTVRLLEEGFREKE